MAATIGIKEANGDFYSILEENSAVKKRLVLTTAHNNQNSVQIDMYKSYAKTMADALYIGSIVVDNISPGPKGDPSIALTIRSTKDGAVAADAVDMGNPSNRQQLSVHLKSFEEDQTEYPDFDMDEEEMEKPEKSEPKFPWAAVFIIGIVLILICLGIWFFLFRTRQESTGWNSGAEQKPLFVRDFGTGFKQT